MTSPFTASALGPFFWCIGPVPVLVCSAWAELTLNFQGHKSTKLESSVAQIDQIKTEIGSSASSKQQSPSVDRSNMPQTPKTTTRREVGRRRRKEQRDCWTSRRRCHCWTGIRLMFRSMVRAAPQRPERICDIK